jgi:hypothetical protein
MLKVLKPSLVAAFLAASLCITGLSGSPVSAVSEDGWRTWDDMEGGGYAVTYGSQIKIYDCFLGKFPVSLQFRNSKGSWKNMQTVNTKKSSRCDGDYAALFNGRVNALGQQLDDGLYIEMRVVSPASKGYKAYRSAPALIPQYKSRADQISQLGETLRNVLANL